MTDRDVSGRDIDDHDSSDDGYQGPVEGGELIHDSRDHDSSDHDSSDHDSSDHDSTDHDSTDRSTIARHTIDRSDQQDGDRPAVVPDRPGDHPDPATEPWRRLAPGMLLVEPVREIIRFIPMLLVLVFAGRAGSSGPPWGLIGTGAVVALGISRWLTTRYRVTPTIVEVRRGVFRRQHLTVPRDRVRTVDISAHPLQRLFRLVKVQIGTGTAHQGAHALTLDGLPAGAGAALRSELLGRLPMPSGARLHRPQVADAEGVGARIETPARTTDLDVGDPASVIAESPGPTPVTENQDPTAETELAGFDPRWVRYAPATLSGVITAAFLIGLGWRIINEASVNPAELGVVDQTLRYLRGTDLWLDILLGAAVVIVAVTLLSLAGYVLSYWGFRLTRHRGGTLQVNRGLLTTRSISVEERRLHGVERVEPLLLRAVGGARLQAIATGLRHQGSGGGSERGNALLMPPAPLATVVDVESAVLGSAELTTAALATHGPAARHRRFNRALGVTGASIAVLCGATWWADWPPQPAAFSLLALPMAALLARDRYRSLGHLVLADRLIVRVGSLVRRRTVLAVPGVIGVTLRQSVFQRRSGLITLIATTAAGEQRYRVPDLPATAAITLATILVPSSGAFATAHTPVGAAAASGTSGSAAEPHPPANRPGRRRPCCGTSPASADCLDGRPGDCGVCDAECSVPPTSPRPTVRGTFQRGTPEVTR